MFLEPVDLFPAQVETGKNGDLLDQLIRYFNTHVSSYSRVLRTMKDSYVSTCHL
jgi:hypothetical protein